MADIDKGVGRPGSDGPDLGGLDEDILTADLEADLVDDLGDDGLGGDALGDTEESTEEDESEESEESEGGTGDDVMTGGAGDDTFVFTDDHGRDTITDFLAGAAGGDVIDLRRLTAAAAFTDVMAAAAQVGDDTVIDFGDGNSITLLGVDATQLEEQDFLF